MKKNGGDSLRALIYEMILEASSPPPLNKRRFIARTADSKIDDAVRQLEQLRDLSDADDDFILSVIGQLNRVQSELSKYVSPLKHFDDVEKQPKRPKVVPPTDEQLTQYYTLAGLKYPDDLPPNDED